MWNNTVVIADFAQDKYEVIKDPADGAFLYTNGKAVQIAISMNFLILC